MTKESSDVMTGGKDHRIEYAEAIIWKFGQKIEEGFFQSLQAMTQTKTCIPSCVHLHRMYVSVFIPTVCMPSSLYFYVPLCHFEFMLLRVYAASMRRHHVCMERKLRCNELFGWHRNPEERSRLRMPLSSW